jgi:hypothetical protein
MSLTAQQRSILRGLDQGAYFNAVHSAARELIEMGLAREDWGRLAITEAGVVAIRRPHPIISDHVADLSVAIDPMSNPMATPVTPLTGEQVEALSQLQVDVRATDVSEWRQRALKAAGVASGKTGEWPTPVWVEEFINAFDDSR